MLFSMLIVSNWKAYVESAEKAKKLFAVAKRVAAFKKVSIVLAPSAPFLGLLASRNLSKVAFAAQDISKSTGGASTGEVSAQILAGSGARYVIIGHSERRAMGENREIIAEKMRHAVAHGLTPILCIGELERDTEARYLTLLREELTSALFPLSEKQRMTVVIAYEPVWAIGKSSSDVIAESDLQEMVSYIRKVLSELLPGKAAARIPVLYGGSVDPSNIRSLAGGSGVDGFLVGRASTNPETFAGLVKAVS